MLLLIVQVLAVHPHHVRAVLLATAQALASAAFMFRRDVGRGDVRRERRARLAAHMPACHPERSSALSNADEDAFNAIVGRLVVAHLDVPRQK